MPFGRWFRKDDTREDDTRNDGDDKRALIILLHSKAKADFHLNSLRTFQMGDVANFFPYANLNQKHRIVGGQDDDDWQDDNDYVEERLDRLRGGSRIEHETAWYIFTTKSAYSPVRLQRELGWQPTPHGLPSYCDASLFGWVDAFEDLLAASSATSMMSFERREIMNNIMEPIFDLSGGGSHWYLFNRIQWQGLNEVYFPVYWPDVRYRSPRSMEEWIAVRRNTPIPCHNWEQAIGHLCRDIDEVGGIDLLRYLMDNPADEQFTEGEPTWDSVMKVFTALQKMTRRVQSEAEGDNSPSKRPDSPRPPTSEPAETEEDLYLATNSKFDGNTPGGPLTSLFRLMGRTVWGDDMDKDARKTEHKTADGGSETVFEKAEATPDGQGRISIIAIDKKDKHGRITSSEFHASINQPPFSSPFWKKFWENARPHDGSGGSRGEDSK